MIRSLTILVTVLALATLAAGQTFYGTTDIQAFREGRDREFRDAAATPLMASDRTEFKGLRYFPVNAMFRVTAELVRTEAEKVFQMPTSSGNSKKFVKYGVLKFELAGKPFTLSVYQADAESRARNPEFADLLFIPFRDHTNGTETYGAGRYLDIRMPPSSNVTLDFNLAYNPNCAYGSSRYSCPVPPRENFLRTRIVAGELNYEHQAKR
ncbi:MAG: DUF1684 domain-containing protein [Pyrinomonadaceae bacterium]